MATFHKILNPISLKNLELKNRIVMPPMCQYSATDGVQMTGICSITPAERWAVWASLSLR